MLFKQGRGQPALVSGANSLTGVVPLDSMRSRKRFVNGNKNARGFTYIEILIALVVVGVLFIPMLQLFSHGIYSAVISGDTITAVNLARWEMERVKNLNLTTTQLKRGGNIWTPPLDEPPIEMNRARWRIFRRINAESSPLEVNVLVYQADKLDEPPVATADTLIEDNIWVRKVEDLSSELAFRK